MRKWEQRLECIHFLCLIDAMASKSSFVVKICERHLWIFQASEWPPEIYRSATKSGARIELELAFSRLRSRQSHFCASGTAEPYSYMPTIQEYIPQWVGWQNDCIALFTLDAQFCSFLYCSIEVFHQKSKNTQFTYNICTLNENIIIYKTHLDKLSFTPSFVVGQNCWTGYINTLCNLF